MAVKILLMTPVRSFGELVRQALQETDLYRVTLVHDKDQVLAKSQNGDFPVVILDFDLDPEPSDLLKSLDAITPKMRIIAMKDKTSGGSCISPGSWLSKLLDEKFYLPDLLDALDEVTADLRTSISPAGKTRPGIFPSSIQPEIKSTPQRTTPTWLLDTEKTTRYLSNIRLDSLIQAIMITDGGRLRVFTGHLPQSAGEELAQFMQKYWVDDTASDLVRYVRLEAASSEFLVYATNLGGDVVLGLAFDVETPFSKIRAKVSDLAERLITHLQDRPTGPN